MPHEKVQAAKIKKIIHQQGMRRERKRFGRIFALRNSLALRNQWVRRKLHTIMTIKSVACYNSNPDNILQEYGMPKAIKKATPKREEFELFKFTESKK